MPFSSHSFLTSCKNPSGATLIPLSPCTGSKITKAVSSSITDFKDSMSPKDAKDTFSTRGANAFLYFGLNVIDNAPNDFPWYDPFIATMPFFPVNFLANFIAASIASAPLLFKWT